jgi:hypothetical protein
MTSMSQCLGSWQWTFKWIGDVGVVLSHDLMFAGYGGDHGVFLVGPERRQFPLNLASKLVLTKDLVNIFHCEALTLVLGDETAWMTSSTTIDLVTSMPALLQLFWTLLSGCLPKYAGSCRRWGLRLLLLKDNRDSVHPTFL